MLTCSPAVFQKVANHLALIYPGTSYASLLRFRLGTEGLFADNEEKATNPKKFNQVRFSSANDETAKLTPPSFSQDVEWARMAFPADFNSRNKARLDCSDTSLCGKWQVRPVSLVSNPRASAVPQIMKELLDLWDNGQSNKVLIFSISLKVLSLLKDLFEMDASYKVLCLDGSVPADQRECLTLLARNVLTRFAIRTAARR